MKRTIFRYFQATAIVAIFLFWSLVPAPIAGNWWPFFAAAILTNLSARWRDYNLAFNTRRRQPSAWSRIKPTG